MTTEITKAYEFKSRKDAKENLIYWHDAFWVSKIEANMRRDARNARRLRAMGYRVFRFWDCDVLRDAAGCARKVAS